MTAKDETPRTDNAFKGSHLETGFIHEFCRGLETELRAANERVKELCEIIQILGDIPVENFGKDGAPERHSCIELIKRFDLSVNRTVELPTAMLKTYDDFNAFMESENKDWHWSVSCSAGGVINHDLGYAIVKCAEKAWHAQNEFRASPSKEGDGFDPATPLMTRDHAIKKAAYWLEDYARIIKYTNQIDGHWGPHSEKDKVDHDNMLKICAVLRAIPPSSQ